MIKINKDEESLKQAQEGLIRKGLIRVEEDTIQTDVTFEDSREIVRNILFLKQKKMDAAFENLAFLALCLLNKFVDLSKDELLYLCSMALTNTVKWTDYLNKVS